MSDTTVPSLDPKRPWLTDERELPEKMNWAETLFDPTGMAPRLHFTRAWTLLFTLQVVVIVIPFTIALVLSTAGGDGSTASTIGTYMTPVVFIVTTLMSYVIHSRRLNDANKSPLWAIIPLVPLLIGMALFVTTAMSTAAEYDKRFEMRQDYLSDPDAFREKQRAERERAEAEAEAEDNGEARGRGRGGPPGGQGGINFDEPLPPKTGYVLKAAAPTIQMVVIPLSALIAIWSLMWVARVPFFGAYPGSEEAAGRPSRVYQT
ncbi:DUF805 domain-containing protein [Henriciella marina]|uniref:DUF805 domain-containing protein n=1 Tax=Henriciella marina TaxID=453851 RepID=UPI00037FF80F|nr:DUF805 domain-containing protein [Henriciella marina]